MRRAALLLMTIVLCGCASVGVQVAANQRDERLTGVVLPAGWRYVGGHTAVGVVDVTKVVATDFRIGLPDDWDTSELDADAVRLEYRDWARENPREAAKTTEDAYVQDVMAHTKLAAYADAWTKERPIALNIYAKWIDAAVTLDGLIHDQTQSYELEGLTWRSGSRTKLGDRDAFALRMQYPQPVGSRIVTVLTAYLLVREREIWILEFIGPLDQMDRLDPLFDQMAGTFRLI